MNIGQQIKERRKALKISQQTLADLSGVGINTIVAIERNTGNPSLKTLEQILSTLGLKLCLKIKSE
ncbi:MAG: helix-turn-helix domain-containing protein [Bacteroidales bacterium]|nr:helix-turn-helix domain-containing protein [Bacteroidales bacterium]